MFLRPTLRYTLTLAQGNIHFSEENICFPYFGDWRNFWGRKYDYSGGGGKSIKVETLFQFPS